MRVVDNTRLPPQRRPTCIQRKIPIVPFRLVDDSCRVSLFLPSPVFIRNTYNLSHLRMFVLWDTR